MSSDGSGKAPKKGGGISQSFRNLFGKIGGGGIQRAQTMMPSPSPPPIERRRSTITDASTVADAFASGDASAIKGLMKKHEIRSNVGSGVTSGSYNFGVVDTGFTRDRRDSQGQLREMKVFELSTNPNPDTPQFQASYNPMTTREVGWGGSPGDEKLNVGSVAFGAQQDPLEITPRLVGCALVEDAFGNTGHTQPFGRKQDINETSESASKRSATNLKAHKDIKDVFGPEEYGRTGNPEHYGTNAIMFKDQETGDKTILHQDIYRNFSSGEARISVGQKSFGRRFRMGSVPDKEYGSMRPPRPTVGPTGKSPTLQVPNNPNIGSGREPRP